MDNAGKAIFAGLGLYLLAGAVDSDTKSRIGRWLAQSVIDAQRYRTTAKPQSIETGRLKTLAIPTVDQFPALFPSTPTEPSSPRVPQDIATVENELVWRRLTPHPSTIVIGGGRGSGKSALAYKLLEQERSLHPPFVVNPPAKAARLLPEWIGIVNSIEDIPPGSTALVDEAYIQYHSRDSHAANRPELALALNLARQRNITLIFVAQELRQIDKNIVSVADVIVFKQPAALQLEFERPEIRKIAEPAAAEFASVEGDRRRWSYVFAPHADHAGLIRNSLPSFWTPSLSRAFADVGSPPAIKRRGRKLSIQERRVLVRAKRELGWSLAQIARFIGVSKATIVNDLKFEQG